MNDLCFYHFFIKEELTQFDLIMNYLYIKIDNDELEKHLNNLTSQKQPSKNTHKEVNT